MRIVDDIFETSIYTLPSRRYGVHSPVYPQ